MFSEPILKPMIIKKREMTSTGNPKNLESFSVDDIGHFLPLGSDLCHDTLLLVARGNCSRVLSSKNICVHLSVMLDLTSMEFLHLHFGLERTLMLRSHVLELV